MGMNLNYFVMGVVASLVFSRILSGVVIGATLLTKALEPRVAVWVGHLLAFGFILLLMELGRSGDELFPTTPALAYAACFLGWMLVDWLIVTRNDKGRMQTLR